MTHPLTLFEALEAAKTGSRILDLELVNALGGEADRLSCGYRSRRLWWTTWSGAGNHWHALPDLTRSTDAALDLFEGVLPGHSWNLSRTERGGHLALKVGRSHPANAAFCFEGRTRPLLICAAVLALHWKLRS